jgi:hypothetical protein
MRTHEPRLRREKETSSAPFGKLAAVTLTTGCLMHRGPRYITVKVQYSILLALAIETSDREDLKPTSLTVQQSRKHACDLEDARIQSHSDVQNRSSNRERTNSAMHNQCSAVKRGSNHTAHPNGHLLPNSLNR